MSIDVQITLSMSDNDFANSGDRGSAFYNSVQSSQSDIQDYIRDYLKNVKKKISWNGSSFGVNVWFWTFTVSYRSSSGESYIFNFNYTASVRTYGVNFPSSEISFDDIDNAEKSSGGGGINLPSPGFTPPQPSNAKKIEDVPFYQDLKNSGEIGSFDDLTQPEFDYLQDAVQKGEVGLFDTLVDKAKDFFMGSSKDSDVFRDVNISYDGDKPEIVAYYANNGLDTSKSYNINMDGIRVGYKDNGTIHPITTGSNINKNGVYVVSKETKDKFLSNGEMYVAHTEVGSGGFTTPNIVSNVGTGAVIGLLTSGAIDNVAENTVDMLQKGITYVVSKGKNMYQDFTNTGDRSKDLFNHAVQSEAYQKGIQTVVGGAGVVANGGVVSGKVDIDFDGKSIPISVPSSINVPMSVADGTYVPMTVSDGSTVSLDLTPGTALPDVKVDIGDKTIPLNVTGKTISISTGGEVALKVADTTKVELDIPDDAALSVEGLDDNFKRVFANKVANISKTDKIISNQISAHTAEYVTEGGIRVKEGKAANWVDVEYKTTVIENGTEVNKINRDIQAWAGMHSLNPVGSYDDSLGINIGIKKGYYPSKLESGALELTREKLIDKANENVLARAKAKSKADEDNDENNMIDNLFSILGVKLDVPVPTAEQLKNSPDLGAILQGLRNLGIINNSN